MDLARVGTYPSVMEADLVKARLAANGIDSVVQSDTSSGAIPEFTRGVRVFVRPEDLGEALEILEQMLPAPG
jgi:hypothetical protein